MPPMSVVAERLVVAVVDLVQEAGLEDVVVVVDPVAVVDGVVQELGLQDAVSGK